MPNITVYKAAVGNLSLKHNFICTIPNLPGAGPLALVQFLARSLTVPASTSIATPVEWQGRKGEFPGSVDTQGDWNLTVQLDSNWLLYTQLYAARQLVGNHITGAIGAWNTVAFSTVVQVLNHERLPIRTFTLLDCYLKQLGEVQKDTSSQADPDECVIQIHYDNWTMT